MNEAPVDTSPPSTRRHELGILLVHGIGSQKQGETLRGFGLPLSRWLKRWLSHPERTWLEAGVTRNALNDWISRKSNEPDTVSSIFSELWNAAENAPMTGEARHWSKVEAVSATIGYPTISATVDFQAATPAGDARPASTVLDIRLLNVENGLEERQWLVAESWWAESFPSPKYRQLLWWGFKVVPWAVVGHYSRRVIEAFATISDTRVKPGLLEWLRLIVAALWLVVSPAVALVTMMTLIVLGVPALTRVPVIGSWVKGVQRTLVETLGDSLVFTKEEIDSAQIKTSVTKDLEWLFTQCEKVAVIAHSQGAAVSHTVLSERARHKQPPIDLLITFGSGLRKLFELRKTRSTLHLTLGWLVVFGFTLDLISIFVSPGASPFSVAMRVGGLALAIAGIGPIFMLVTSDSPELINKVNESWRHSLTWEDFYASHDPVSNGKLFLISGAPLVSKRIHNRASIYTDHTTYWDNVDDFVGRVIHELTKLSQLRSSIDEEKLKEATADATLQREWRVGWLQFGRAVLSVLFVAVAWRSAVFLSPFLSRTLPLAAVPVSLAAGVAGSAIAIQLEYLMLRGAWRWWDATDGNRLFAREPYEDRCLAFLFFAIVLGGTIGLAGSASVFPWTRQGVVNMLPWGLGSGCVTGLIVGLVGPSLRSKRSQVRAKQTRTRLRETRR
jgi:hypothetical protein